MSKKVTNKEIAARLVKQRQEEYMVLGFDPGFNDPETVYLDIREENGNPVQLKGYWAKTAFYLPTQRVERILDIAEEDWCHKEGCNHHA